MERHFPHLTTAELLPISQVGDEWRFSDGTSLRSWNQISGLRRNPYFNPVHSLRAITNKDGRGYRLNNFLVTVAPDGIPAFRITAPRLQGSSTTTTREYHRAEATLNELLRTVPRPPFYVAATIGAEVLAAQLRAATFDPTTKLLPFVVSAGGRTGLFPHEASLVPGFLLRAQ